MTDLRFAWEDVLFLEGCPHCGDGIPKVVTIRFVRHDQETQFVGDWSPELKSAALRLRSIRIISCRPVEGVEQE